MPLTFRIVPIDLRIYLTLSALMSYVFFLCNCTDCIIMHVRLLHVLNKRLKINSSGLVVACLTAVREVLGSNRAAGRCVYH